MLCHGKGQDCAYKHKQYHVIGPHHVPQYPVVCKDLLNGPSSPKAAYWPLC